MRRLNRIKIVAWVIPLTFVIASCVSSEKYASAQQDIERLRTDSITLAEEVKASEEEIRSLTAQKVGVQYQLHRKQRQISQKEKLLAKAKKRANANKRKLNQIAKDLELFNSSYSTVTVEDGHIKLVMEQAILFEQGSASINNLGNAPAGKAGRNHQEIRC